MSTLSIIELNEAYRKVRDIGPILQAVWVVDHPEFEYQVREIVEKPRYNEIANLLQMHAGFQTPVYCFDSRISTGDELERLPSWIVQPGIYLQMSDGHHKVWLPNKQLLADTKLFEDAGVYEFFKG